MVLEQLYSAKWIEKKTRYAFLMGVSYSILGIIAAMLLFPQDPGIAAIAFTSLLILPSLTKLLSIEANQAARKKKFNILELFKEHSDIFRIYIFLFLGIMVSFAFFSIVWPNIATSRIFIQQAGIFSGLGTGNAALGISGRYLLDLIRNNMVVLIVCFGLSLFYGTGAIFILTWNASVWGVVFGLIAKNSATVSGANPFLIFGATLLAVLPHLILEASAYILSAVSGGVVSKAVIREKVFSKRFNQIIEDGLIIFVTALVALIIAVFIEAYIPGYIFHFFNL